MHETAGTGDSQGVCGYFYRNILFYVLFCYLLLRDIEVIGGGGGGGVEAWGDSSIKMTGVLVGNFEKNP